MCVYKWQTMLNYYVGVIMYNMRFSSATGRRHVCPNVHFQIWGGGGCGCMIADGDDPGKPEMSNK